MASPPSSEPEHPSPPERREDRDRVLVAEDNDLLGEHVSRILSPYWEVILCRNGEQAWRTTREQLPDLVLSDVMMPGMDGIELCEHIKQDPATREIPVVLVTALGEIEDRLRGFDAGADEYVTKPFAARELVARLRVLLELRRAKRRLEKHTESLERLVDAQVGHILEQNQKLTRANRQMEDFLAVAAHDLRSPLVSISGFVDLLRGYLGDPIPEEVSEALGRIDVNIDWMANLTARLLSLSTVHTARDERRMVELAVLFESVALRTHETVARAGGSLSIEATDRQIPGDPVHLEEALVNLIENATKYRSPRRPLQVSLRVLDDPPGDSSFAEIVVEDNGRGIPPAHRERVFEPLVRLETGVGQGAGFGLHIVRRVAETAGGRVWIEGEEGEGIRVHLRLPTQLVPEGEEGPRDG
ncbi:MAG: hybrid sensor histidine kinase/response regulator [Deltaproteobacteria bacterium]|nr:hybrid sensor histidine kinase/response regulator [Deltaproteobacteria bacterium]